ncbi:conjugative transfer protein MobI(A/C) [Vibrio aestuarianus]|uniref:conjugative transfer protein MobI(A/C) n=1 Tax=Vibrio aestuarianus TaxID=28171 RepID=UPI00237CD8D2|nr:conjugative transfer protein MobI(A/C) [Vibrio aestuarianus]MDE1237842.1 hypothetical protein [Vibrio aestuarianus]
MKSLLAIQEDLDELYEESKYVFELWMRRVAEREVERYRRKDRKEKTNYQLSLEFHGSSFRVRWIYVRFVKNNERIVRVAKPIAMPRNYKYGRSKFKYADPWEIELIEQIEEVLHLIRLKSSALMKAHQTLLKMNKSIDRCFECSTTKQRVKTTSQSISKYKLRLTS